MRIFALLLVTFAFAGSAWAAQSNIAFCNKSVSQMVADTNASKADLPRRVKSGQITQAQSDSTAAYYDNRLAGLKTMTDTDRQKRCAAMQKFANRFRQGGR